LLIAVYRFLSIIFIASFRRFFIAFFRALFFASFKSDLTL